MNSRSAVVAHISFCCDLPCCQATSIKHDRFEVIDERLEYELQDMEASLIFKQRDLPADPTKGN